MLTNDEQAESAGMTWVEAILVRHEFARWLPRTDIASLPSGNFNRGRSVGVVNGSYHIASAGEVFAEKCVIGECASLAVRQNDYGMELIRDGPSKQLLS